MKTIFTWIVFFVITSTLTAQWVRQHPFPKLENINDIEISNGGLGFAVGNNAVAFKTVDGGGTWEWENSFVEGWDFNVVEMWKDQNGDVVLIGGNGLLLSNDGGITWIEVIDAPQDILEMKIISGDAFWIATTLGVFKTEDAGISWIDLNLPVTAMQDAHILDDTHMWASTILPDELWMTEDGGENWVRTTEVVRHDLVHFFDQNNGLLLDGRDVYKTANGGQSWTLISDNGLQSNAFHIDFGSDRFHVFAALNGGRINYSTDGGTTWEQTSFSNIPNGLAASVYAVNNQEVYFGGELSTILKSTDQLQTIEELTGGSRRSIADMDMKNLAEGIAVGTQGTLIKTMDGGQNWIEMDTEFRNYLSVDFVNDDNIWTGSNQRILHSTDGGITWNEKLVLTNSNIQGVKSINDSTILALSTTGIIYRSANSGMSWDTVFYDANDNGRFVDIEFTDALTGYVCGFNRNLLKTIDGGISWNALTPPVPDLQYDDFSFLSNEEGWLVSSSFEDRMWHTSDGGSSWETLQLPVIEFWTGVHFISPDTGVVVHKGNERGGAFLTFDGGQTWPSAQETSFSYNGVSGTNGPNAGIWIYGAGGNIEALLNCDAIPSISELTVENIFPCQGDTILCHIQGSNIETYEWSFPAGWTPFGNIDTSTVSLVANGSFGYISVFGKNECGITSSIDQQVSTAIAPDIFIELVNDTLLELSDEADGYQWYLDGMLISGATMSFHIAQTNGQYFCELFFTNGCSGFSDSVDISIITTSTNNLIDFEGTIMPLPAENIIVIESPEIIKEIWIYNLWGQLVDQTSLLNNRLDISHLSEGIYVFWFASERGWCNKKVPVMR